MTPEHAEFLRERLLEKCADEHALTLVAIDAIPEDKLHWKPEHEKCFTTAALAEHAVTAAVFFVQQVEGKHPPSDDAGPIKTKRELVERVNAASARFTDKLTSMSAEELAKDLDFGGQAFPALEVLSWHPWHMVHHRGQLLLYLRLMGARVPSTYGPSGDETGDEAQAG